jgi:hypothetical protein
LERKGLVLRLAQALINGNTESGYEYLLPFLPSFEYFERTAKSLKKMSAIIDIGDNAEPFFDPDNLTITGKNFSRDIYEIEEGVEGK